jgi:hypothetical protein
MIAKMNPILLIFQSLNWIKTFALWFFPSLLGWAASVFFQVPSPPAHWYEQPAVIAGLVSGAVVLIALFLNRYFQKKDKKSEDAKARDQQHTTFSEKMQELAQNQTQTVYPELEKLHNKEIRILTEQFDREVGFWKREYSTKSRSDFESRLRAHAAVNEANRLKGHIFILHSLMSGANVPLPEFTPKTGDEIYEGIAEQMLAFKDDLIDRYEKAMKEDVKA